MSPSPGGFSSFWKEVKRRRILRSLTICAGTGFIVLEATTIIFPRWGLPDWTIDLVLWLLVAGMVINLIIAWFYDITSEGIQRTKSAEESDREERMPDSRGWKAATSISLVVIVGLILLNVPGGTKQLRAGDMGRVSNLRVIGKTSSMLYKEAEMSAGDIAGELNVDAVLEATVMCLEDSICMQFRLISTKGEEEQLWVGEYREDKRQILNLFNRVNKQIAEEVRIELSDSEERFFDSDRGADRKAIDAYIQSSSYWGDLGADALDKAEAVMDSLQVIKKK